MKLFKTERSPRKRGKVTKRKGTTKGRQSKLGEKKTQKRKLPYTIKPSKRQVGTTNRSLDKKRKALKPGVRRSKSGREYIENRKNRSDLTGDI